LAYLLTYFIADVIAAVAWNRLKMTQNWKTGLTFGIYCKNSLSNSRPWVCGLGLACLWPWPTGLDTSGLVNIPAPTNTKVGYIGDKVVGEDLVLPG